jgi:hypothetical protein
MVSQILAFLFYMDPLTSSLTASSIAVASIQLACQMLTGYYAVSPSDVKLASDSFKERLILYSEDQKTQVHEATERMKGLLGFVFSPQF